MTSSNHPRAGASNAPALQLGGPRLAGNRETLRAAGLSIASNATLTLLKLVTGLLTGSVSVVAEAIHSANDLLASLLAYYAIRKAGEPPDAEHQYGHGKYESVSAFIEALLIIGAAVAVAWVALRRLLSGEAAALDHGPALLVMGLSTVVNLLVSAYLFRVARRHDSVALEADAWHLRADVYTSLGVFVALALIWVTGWHIVDPLAALAVAGLIFYQGGRLSWGALQQLVDRSLPPEELALIHDLLADHEHLFVGYHRLRARKAGRERHLDLHLVTCPQLTVQEAHEVCDHLEREIAERLPESRVVIHVEPCREENCPNRLSSLRNPEVCVLKQRLPAVNASDHPREA